MAHPRITAHPTKTRAVKSMAKAGRIIKGLLTFAKGCKGKAPMSTTPISDSSCGCDSSTSHKKDRTVGPIEKEGIVGFTENDVHYEVREEVDVGARILSA